MQNVQNTEIQQRVINLVELYRTKVGKESNIAIVAKQEVDQSFGLDIHDIVFVDKLRVDEQLICHFYSEVASDAADKDIIQSLLPENPNYYDNTIFTEDEEAFLVSHFKEMTNYIIQTPSVNLEEINVFDRKGLYIIPEEVLKLISERIQLPKDAIVYNPFACFAQFANLFPECKFLCEESYGSYFKKWNAYADKCRKTSGLIHSKYNEKLLPTWMKIALYANNSDATIIEDHSIPQSFDAVVSYIPFIPKVIPNNDFGNYPHDPEDSDISNKIFLSYQKLKMGGKMILVIPTTNCYINERNSLKRFINQIIEDESLAEIIELPFMEYYYGFSNHSIIIIEKGRKENKTIMIDAYFASKKSEKKHTWQKYTHILDMDLFNTMIQNNGFDAETGLRKMVSIQTSNLKKDLSPRFYVIDKPSEKEHPVPLSNLCQLETKRVRSVKSDLPLTTPWVYEKDLSTLFHGALEISTLEQANCPNNPPHTNDYDFDESDSFIENTYHYINRKNTKGLRVARYRECIYIDGNIDAIICNLNEDGIKTALIRSTGNPIAVNDDDEAMRLRNSIIDGTGAKVYDKEMHVLYPTKEIDALSLLAIIRMPIVYRQLQVFGFGHLEEIIVPTNKRIIYDEKQRLLNEEKEYKKLKDKFTSMKTEYINEVRMRKHDMGQYIFELGNIEDLIRYYIENRDTEKNYCKQIEDLLDNFRSSLDELSTLLDNLSKEEHFGEPELFNFDVFLSQLANRHKADGYSINYELDKQSFRKFSLKIASGYDILEDIRANIDDTITIKDENTNVSILEVTKIPHKAVPTLHIAPNDIYRAINNIIDNARRHGFTDPNRKDYEIKVSLSIDVEREMYQIDFRNNGNPLPEGMNKMRYGIKGEKAGKTSGTGLGGNYVKTFVEHYGGDYDIFMEDGWTVVRICLPIKQ